MSLLGRDFGPMLTAEKSSGPPSDTSSSGTDGRDKEESDEEEGTHEMRERALSVQDNEGEEDTYSGRGGMCSVVLSTLAYSCEYQDDWI